MILAPLLVSLVIDRLPPGLNLIRAVEIDWRSRVFAGVTATSILFATALLSVRYAVRRAIVGTPMSQVNVPGRARFSRLLVAGQIALAFGLMLGGTMFVASLGLVWREDPGIRTKDTALLSVSFGGMMASTRAHDIAAMLRSVPGVLGAGALTGRLFDNAPGLPSPFLPPPSQPANDPGPALVGVGPGFLQAAELQLLQGRLPTDAELETGAAVVAVSEQLARRYWPNGEAVGQTLTPRQGRPHTVVAVVRDARIVALDVAPREMIIAPFTFARRFATAADLFLALDAAKPAALVDIESHLARVAPGVRVMQYQLIDDAVSDSIRSRRISAFAASAFAVSALALVALSLFGLVAQSASWRTREIGVRLALGDTPIGVVRRILVEPLGAVITGLAAGAILAALVAGTVRSYLYGIAPYDISVWATTVVVMLGIALAGAIGPAIRAGRIDPLDALRHD